MKIPIAVLLSLLALAAFPLDGHADIRVGATITDVTPVELPVLVNGGMYSRSVDTVRTPLYARSIIVDDGQEQLAIVVVDSCMLPRPLLDEAKQLAAEKTGIAADHILISATHAHSVPSSMGCLGTDTDEAYASFLKPKLAESIEAAQQHLEPAQVGWATGDASEYTALRRWSLRPDKVRTDPFGNPSVRATMHAGNDWSVSTGETGPEDPALSLISFQSLSGRPIALLANFSMHYYGDAPLSADYFGLFCNGLQEKLGQTNSPEGTPDFVGIMSHGCSGDIYLTDYTLPKEERSPWKNITNYAAAMVGIALDAYETIEYRSDVDIDMAERRLAMNYRVPDKALLESSQKIVDTIGDRAPKTTEEVYAREQLLLHERQSTEIALQALRIGDIAIATTPNETYALTGLKLKLQSPLPKTMVIELANGGDGYIPPPEQHYLGGYNTWAARSAGLEVQAEPRIVEADLQLLESVAGAPRENYQQRQGIAAQGILKAQPSAYWRMDNMGGSHILDVSGNNISGFYESGMCYFLEGPLSAKFNDDGEVNRAAHFVGGRMSTKVPELGNQYSVSLWFWNGMPADARPVSGWMFSRGHDFSLDPKGDSLGLGGIENSGKLLFLNGSDESKTVAGKTVAERWTWNHAVLVRDGQQVRVYLNGELEIETALDGDVPLASDQVFIGGRTDSQSNWEGRLDEVAVFDRVLTPAEIQALAVKE
jgi:hypothetical protein